MATKKKAARKGTKRAKPRRMNAARRTTRRRSRRMHGASGGVMGAASTLLLAGAGAIGAELLRPHMLKLVKKQGAVDGIYAGLGLLGSWKLKGAPQALAAGVGVSGLLGLGSAALKGSGLKLATLNGARRLDPAEHRAIVQRLKEAGKAYRGMNGGTPPVLNGGTPPVLNGMSFDGGTVVGM